MIKIVIAAYVISFALFLLFILTDKKRLQYFGIFLLFVCSFPVIYLSTVVAGKDTIVINEVCSNNFSAASNSVGRYPDYIELYNAGDYDVSLLGWALYTESELEEYYEFGDVILQPGASLLLFYSPDTANTYDPYFSMTISTGSSDSLNIPCAVSKEGETLYLCNSAGKTADAVEVPALKYDTVYARGADGNWAVYTPTPGTDNASAIAIHEEFSGEISETPANDADTLILPTDEYSDFWTLSLSVSEEDLYGSAGIFLSENLNLSGRAAECECLIDIYSPGLNYEFSQRAGIRVSGRTNNLTNFDFNLYARDIYESRTLFEFDFLNENLFLDKLHLKYDATQEHLLTQLLNQSDISNISSIPCVLFLNGEFYGTYYLTQPQEEEFLAEENGIALEDLTLLEDGQLANGSEYALQEYRSFLKNAISMDLSVPQNYNYVSNIINMDSLLNYYAVQMYFNNYQSSPYDGSLIWRSENMDDSNSSADGKWHYEIAGLDSTLKNFYMQYGADTDPFEEFIPKDPLFEALLWNDDFYEALYDRISHLSENEFGEKQITELLSKTEYFHQNSDDLISDFKSFFEKRPLWILSDFEKTRRSLLEEAD